MSLNHGVLSHLKPLATGGVEDHFPRLGLLLPLAIPLLGRVLRPLGSFLFSLFRGQANGFQERLHVVQVEVASSPSRRPAGMISCKPKLC